LESSYIETFTIHKLLEDTHEGVRTPRSVL